MSIQSWTYILVGITFSIYISIAIWSRVQSTREFYVAGGGVGAWANGMATAADWMSAASFISMAGIISFAGYEEMPQIAVCKKTGESHLYHRAYWHEGKLYYKGKVLLDNEVEEAETTS